MMLDPVTMAALAAGVGYGIAAIIKATFDGRAKLIRAKRGDTEPDDHRFTLSALFKRRDQEDE